MIADIHGNAELLGSARAFVSAPILAGYLTPFISFLSDGDAMFARLRENVVLSSFWSRNEEGVYVEVLDAPFLIGTGTLCQIGVHLVPDGGKTGGRFCQIVSGEFRGNRFPFKADEFQLGDDLPAAARKSRSSNNQSPKRRGQRHDRSAHQRSR